MWSSKPNIKWVHHPLAQQIMHLTLWPVITPSLKRADLVVVEVALRACEALLNSFKGESIFLCPTKIVWERESVRVSRREWSFFSKPSNDDSNSSRSWSQFAGSTLCREKPRRHCLCRQSRPSGPPFFFSFSFLFIYHLWNFSFAFFFGFGCS